MHPRPTNRIPAEPDLSQPDDGTRQLLQWGAWILGSGIAAAVLLITVLGGFSPTGASTAASAANKSAAKSP